jgi:type II secretory pathway pseudopilin PulG
VAAFRLKLRAARQRARHDVGSSLFELVVALIIISVLAAVLLNRLGYYKEMLEKAAMESTLRNIKTGLQVQLAELIVTNRQAQAGRLENEDPSQWLDEKPPNYGGSYRVPPVSGTWYFDTATHELVYVVNTGNRLEIDTDTRPIQLRFRARVLKDRLNLFGNSVESVAGVALVPAQPYRWQ